MSEAAANTTPVVRVGVAAANRRLNDREEEERRDGWMDGREGVMGESTRASVWVCVCVCVCV